MWTNEEMCRIAAEEFRDGMTANLGIGMPTKVAGFIPEGMHVSLHSENGMLGMGPYPTESELDPDLINAGKETVTILPDGSYFDSAASFGMIRGGHVDLTIMGALEVSERGDLANWTVPGKMVKGMGGAMDLVAGAKRIIILMTHTTKEGAPKILKECTLPLTGRACVHRIVTEYAVLDVTPRGLVAARLAEGITLEHLQSITGAPVHAAA